MPRSVPGRIGGFEEGEFEGDGAIKEVATQISPSRPFERFGWTFAPGDKIMQIENDYDQNVYNGDIGYSDDVDSDSGELTASFDGRAVTYGFGELDSGWLAATAMRHRRKSETA